MKQVRVQGLPFCESLPACGVPERMHGNEMSTLFTVTRSQGSETISRFKVKTIRIELRNGRVPINSSNCVHSLNLKGMKAHVKVKMKHR